MNPLIRQPRTGEPWTEWDDAHLKEDCRAGCSVFVMALRARRTEAEVRERLAVLGMVAKGG